MSKVAESAFTGSGTIKVIMNFFLFIQVRTICADYGVVCIHREGQDIERIISNDEILKEYKVTICLGFRLGKPVISAIICPKFHS